MVLAEIDEPMLELVSIDGLLPGASNATLLARDADGRPWVYKPEQGERPLWDFGHGSLARREVACFRVARALGVDVVPETRMATGPLGTGSAQRFLDEDFSWDPRDLIVEADPVLWPIAVLDVIANNADRKIGHLLREPGADRIWAIDNGLTFHVETKLRTVLWNFGGSPIPPDIADRLDPTAVGAALESLLSDVEVDAAMARTESLRDEPVHPEPPHDRPALPWPVW